MIVRKATHSSYIQVGADLGIYGMFLYLAGIWCAVRTLLSMQSTDDTEERCRRAILLMIAGYALSGWMINRQYHTEYFLLIAAAAAAHRLKKGAEIATTVPTPEPDPEVSPLLVNLPNEPAQQKRLEITPAFRSPEKTTSGQLRPLWNRPGLADLVICAGLAWLTFWAWDYLMQSI